MSEAEEILTRLESRNRSFRLAFCLAMSGLAVLVVANKINRVPDVIRAKTFRVNDNGKILASVGLLDGKIIFGTNDGKMSLVSIGQSSIDTGAVVLSSAKDGNANHDLVRLSGNKTGSATVSVYDSKGTEIANGSPNVNQSGSLFIQNSDGTLIGEINGDKLNGGAIITHDAKGTETARVHD